MMVSKVFLILIFSFFWGRSAFAAERSMPAFAPRNPMVMGRGGTAVASASGYESLFTNPAGFAAPGAAATALSLNPWIYIDPLDVFSLTREGGRADYWERNAVSGGAGGGGSFGIGYAGKGVGLGFIGSGDGLFEGTRYPDDVEGTFLTDFCIVGGLAFTVWRTDSIRLIIGADLRPGIRFYAPVGKGVASAVDEAAGDDAAVAAALDGAVLHQGAALAFDAGLMLQLGDSFGLGFSVRDIMGTRYAMSSYPLGGWIEVLRSQGLPEGGVPAADDFYVPMTLTFGAVLRPTTNLSLQAEYDHTPGAEAADTDAWKLLSFGLEAQLLGRLSLRAGMDHGMGAVGLGLRLAFMDLNAAADEKGISLEWAIRF